MLGCEGPSLDTDQAIRGCRTRSGMPTRVTQYKAASPCRFCLRSSSFHMRISPCRNFLLNREGYLTSSEYDDGYGDSYQILSKQWCIYNHLACSSAKECAFTGCLHETSIKRTPNIKDCHRSTNQLDAFVSACTCFARLLWHAWT